MCVICQGSCLWVAEMGTIIRKLRGFAAKGCHEGEICALFARELDFLCAFRIGSCTVVLEICWKVGMLDFCCVFSRSSPLAAGFAGKLDCLCVSAQALALEISWNGSLPSPARQKLDLLEPGFPVCFLRWIRHGSAGFAGKLNFSCVFSFGNPAAENRT